MRRLFRYSSFFVCCLILLAGCAKQIPQPEAPQPQLLPYQRMVRDLQTIPQDLMPFARAAGADKALITPAEQTIQNNRANRMFFNPWTMTKASTPGKELAVLFRRARGYKQNGLLWQQYEWDAMRANADLGTYPSMAQRGIITRHADLRELPADGGTYDKPTPEPKADPFDNFQYSSLPLGTPLFITHMTRDRQWFLVETSFATGWVRAGRCGLVDNNFMQAYRTDEYLAIIQDHVAVKSDALILDEVGIGAVFPLVKSTANELNAFVPVRDSSGKAQLRQVSFSSARAVKKPLALTPGNVAKLGNVMMGEPYGWGGNYGRRDCSSTTRDLFTPFGIWLPRNSLWQKKTGFETSLEGLSPSEKKELIRRNARPFLTLLWLPGHITLYVGSPDGVPMMFHNMWGIRVVEGDDDDARHVLGRCVITTTEPGKELPNRIPDGLCLDRMKAFSILPGDRS